MTFQEFKQNFLPEFLKIKSFAGKIKYANQYLQRIGGGTGRIVYDIDGEKVLKLAKNPKGVAQNEAEAGAGYYRDTQHIVTIIFDSADDDSWLISEKAKKVTEKRIKELTGIPSLNDLYQYLRNFHSTNNGKGNVFGQDEKMIEFLNENEFAQDLENFIANYGQSPGDMDKPSTYGEVLRNGQPTIVLTDYGLNDEVYDSHYNPDRKQRYRMYEMYGFADGNDDMLSNVGNTGEVRHSMWALNPYGVEDNAVNEGDVDEDFISFVLNRNKYPIKNLPSAPYLSDKFHECINNLNEVLDKVEDKPKFYNNLLELQNYLIRGKFFDRDPLEKEDMVLHEADMPSVQPNELDKNVADGIAKALAAKLNLGEPQHLGGGGFGEAYLINGNKVLKLTTDVCEVFAGGATHRAKPKTLVYVDKMYKVFDTTNNIAVYALIEDYIADKPYEEFIRLQEIINSLDPSGENGLYYHLLDILVKGKSKNPQFTGMTLNNFPQLAERILTNIPEANVTQADRQKAYQYMMGLYAIKQDLIKLGIKSNDFMTTKNLGYKNGILTYFDIGGCHAQEPEFPPENVVTLPESVELLNESISKESADMIANRVAELYKLNTPKYIKSGTFGAAYDIGDNKVLKVTSDRSEAVENLELIGKKLEYIAEPYKVFEIKPKSGETKYYAIILEKLKTSPQYFGAMKERLDYVFEKIMGVQLGDVLDHYVYGYDAGVNENMIEKYLSKNPKDAEYFNGLLKIAEECKKYGVESMDYINPTNLGYKPNGNMGFFDVGFGNYFAKSGEQPEPVQMDVNEDGSSKFSYPNAVGQDNFPPYDNNDDSVLYDNNIPVNLNTNSVAEDLEYNHVVGDATMDKFAITERQISAMPGSTGVEVKKKCRLAGNGNTSTACNQGDIGNLNLTSINEEIDMDTLNRGVDRDEMIKVDNFPLKNLTVSKRGMFGAIQDIKQGRPSTTNAPILVFYNIDKQAFLVEDGYHRVAQAYLNKETTVPVEIYSDKWSDYVANISPENKFNLTEVGEGNTSTYPVSIHKSTDDYKEYWFTTEDGDKYFIEIKRYYQGENKWHTSFGVSDPDEPGGITYTKVVNKGKMYKVMATIMKVMRGFFINSKPDELTIEPTKTKNADDRRKFSLYLQFIEKNLPPEYKYSENDKEIVINKINDLNEAQLMSLQDLPFKQEVEQLGGKIFSVGGAVRDEFLGKESKDLDVLITGVPMDQLEEILGKYGRVDAVGKSFGVLKFKPRGATEDIDIAIPRTEIATGTGGHKGFEVSSDHALPIEKDLERRDFTINAIAKDTDGNIIDPYGGREDLKNKIIRIVNPEAFSDDPLRMLRAVQFASRFGFEIEPQTMQMIKDNASRIKEIPPERILTEFDKIIKKGNPLTGAFLLKNTGLLRQIFGVDAGLLMGQNIWDGVKTMGEFIWMISHNLVQDPSAFYKNNLKGDIDTFKEIRALQMAFDSGEATNMIEARAVASNMYLTSPQTLQSQIIPNVIRVAAQELLSGKYPKSINDLAVNGNDLMQMGLKGKEIGDALRMMLLKVYSGRVRNNREELLSLLPGKDMIKEENGADRIEYGCLMLFLDVPIWEKITSVIKPEDVFDEPGYGIEKEPHLTILYGFHDEVGANEVFDLYKQNFPLQPIEVKIAGISVFENPNFDVVKFDVNSELLTKINSVMKQLPNTSKFPEYHAHITLAYVKKGEGSKYIRPFEKERVLSGNELVFTWKGHRGNDGEKLMLDEKGLLRESAYGTLHPEQKNTWEVNGQNVDIYFFVKKYDEWNNQGGSAGYKDPSKASVLEFFQNNYEDFSHDEKLKQELLWALTDRDLLDE